jgi:hypothetical protein
MYSLMQKITVFDVLSKEVAILINQQLHPAHMKLAGMLQIFQVGYISINWLLVIIPMQTAGQAPTTAVLLRQRK